MKHSYLPLFLLACLSCQRPPSPAPVGADSAPDPISATRWSPKTELFVEYPPLLAGQVSRFAIHLTRLDSFKALREGSVEVELLVAGRAPERFGAKAPSRPGIFGVDVKPSVPGNATLTIHYLGEGLSDSHSLGTVNVTTAPPPASPSEEDSSAVSFLKEQQWTLDFATALVEVRSMQTDLRVPAEVTPRSGGLVDVDAPFDGRLTADPLPALGSPVRNSQILAQMILPTNTPNDLAALELARQEANLSLNLARKDRQRVERLLGSGAIPARRLDEATVAEQSAAARLIAAETRLAQYEASRAADSPSRNAKLFAIRAPIGGIVESVKTAPSAVVRAGDPLFQVVDLDTVYVAAIVPEAEFPRVRSLGGAELEVPGLETPRRLSRLVHIGRVVDAPSRTFPITYEVDNRDRRLAINQTVYVRIFTSATQAQPSIPESALVDDNGAPIVYVQLSGESFARRPVKLGSRSSGFVQVLEGLSPGERIVTKGAHLIRLAALSNQVPAHGHVH